MGEEYEEYVFNTGHYLSAEWNPVTRSYYSDLDDDEIYAVYDPYDDADY